nr:ABC transporter permease [Chloroflexia bacterium]
MIAFILRRLVYLIPVWIGISLVAFVLANLAPGDPARLALQRELGRQPTAEETAIARDRMGLNDAAPIRYLNWLGDAVTGDLGTSYRTGQPVLDSLLDRFPTTLQIAGIGL